jgi:predicted PurR-regulated permease PerM
MNMKLTPRALYGAVILVLAVWVLHSFLLPLLVAGVTAIASWPLCRKFRAHLAARASQSTTAVAFTLLMTTFVLAPLFFALAALLTEAHTLLVDIAAADSKGITPPHWLDAVPLAGPWLAERWRSDLARPGALGMWVQQTGPALLGWAQSLGQFTARHAIIIGFAILLLVFLYREGESLARQFRQLARHCIGERSDIYVDLAARAVRSSVNSILVVALFDGFASGLVYAITGVPHAAVWAAITGSLALVPFLGYVGVGALGLKLAMAGPAAAAWLVIMLGSAVLFFGDKVLRPVMARRGTHLGFVWVLMGCLGGFEALGLIGLVIGPVVLTLARELWQERVRHLAASPGFSAPGLPALSQSPLSPALAEASPRAPRAHAGR